MQNMCDIFEKRVSPRRSFVSKSGVSILNLKTGSVRVYRPDLWEASRKALRLCVNLEGFTWSDDSSDFGGEQDLMEHLDVLQQLPVRELILRTFYGLSDEIWERLQAFTDIKKISIWCVEGKPRILQGWSEKLGPSLAHLELGVSPLFRVSPLDRAS